MHTRSDRRSGGPRLARRATRRVTLVQAEPLELQAPAAPLTRERAAGGPEDRAAYCCSCGCVFEAPVSTTVDCPHCGGAQAW
ncbi:MAG: hypothetical protein ACTHOE_06970 [Conexibacter sp.]